MGVDERIRVADERAENGRRLIDSQSAHKGWGALEERLLQRMVERETG